ncbi:MAG: SRPBCC family protein [Saprospiraceae bacterium]|nr:SRPBCC family protein [Saprospiraceae bacterium]
MKLSTEILIARPLEDVFAYWADLERAGEWAAPVIERRKLTEGPVRVGSQFLAIDQFPGQRVEFIVEVTAFQPNELMAATWNKPMKGGWKATFSPHPEGTRLHVEAEMIPTGFLKLLSPILMPWAKRAMKKDFSAFKQRLEEGRA